MQFLGLSLGENVKIWTLFAWSVLFFGLNSQIYVSTTEKIQPDLRKHIKSAKNSNFGKTAFFEIFCVLFFQFLIFDHFLGNFNLKLEETNPHTPKCVISMQKINKKTKKNFPKLSFIQCTVPPPMNRGSKFKFLAWFNFISTSKSGHH